MHYEIVSRKNDCQNAEECIVIAGTFIVPFSEANRGCPIGHGKRVLQGGCEWGKNGKLFGGNRCRDA